MENAQEILLVIVGSPRADRRKRKRPFPTQAGKSQKSEKNVQFIIGHGTLA